MSRVKFIELDEHLLIHGDALTTTVETPADCALVFDPPYDEPACAVARWTCASALVFTDPNRHLTMLSAGWPLPLRWVFTWDTLNPLWVSATQPLRRSKLCLWHGEGVYDQQGQLYGEPPAPHRQRPRNGASGTGGDWKAGWYASDPRGKHLATVYTGSKTAMTGGHPHAKPEEWMRLLLANCCAGQDVVFDPFAGGGSSLIAADRLGKRWIGVESDPVWCEAIVERYEKRKNLAWPEQLAMDYA